MFENIINFFKKMGKKKEQDKESKDTAKERLHLVLMQDRANVSADFLDLMKQEIIEVIKKYIDVDENAIDVRLTNKTNTDGTSGAPALYANIPIMSIKNEVRHLDGTMEKKKEEENKQQEDKQSQEKAPDLKEKQSEKKEAKNEDKQENVKEEVVEQKEEKTEKDEEEQQETKTENQEVKKETEKENPKKDEDNHEKKDS